MLPLLDTTGGAAAAAKHTRNGEQERETLWHHKGRYSEPQNHHLKERVAPSDFKNGARIPLEVEEKLIPAFSFYSFFEVRPFDGAIFSAETIIVAYSLSPGIRLQTDETTPDVFLLHDYMRL